MKNLLKTAVTITILSSLTACGGGSGPTETIIIPDVAKTCDAILYRETTGSYSGRIEYKSPDWVQDKRACAWEVSLSVDTEADANGLCQTGFDYQSTLTDGPLECADLSVTGDVNHDYYLDENNPQWPVELAFRSARVTDVFTYYSPGNVDSGGWEFIFDGKGNASTDQVSELDGWSGVLVRFSDQPFQEDNGLFEGEGYEND